MKCYQLNYRMKMYVNWNQNSPPIVILTQCTAFYCRWRRWKLFVLCEKKENGEILWLTFTRKLFSFKYLQRSSRRKYKEKLKCGKIVSLTLMWQFECFQEPDKKYKLGFHFFIHMTITVFEALKVKKWKHAKLSIVTLFSK